MINSDNLATVKPSVSQYIILNILLPLFLEWKHLLKTDRYKDVIIESLKFIVAEKRVEVKAFSIMNNRIHLIWQIQNGYEREDVQRIFLKFTSQTIKRNLQKNHPAVSAFSGRVFQTLRFVSTTHSGYIK
jgi:REP element-mobilizing transposase RayT